MNKYDLIRKIEEFAPPETQEEWDCSGWLVETDKKEVNKIMLALTVTDEVFEQAKTKNCDFIISHHPLFTIPIKYKEIDIYAAHTNMDKAKGGTTDTLIQKLGFQISEYFGDFVRIVRLNKPISTEELFNKLKTISSHSRMVNNKGVKEIKSIGFCAGSGSEFIEEVEVDAFVTGDLKYHCAAESGIILFDIGHFESEILVLDTFEKILGTEVVRADEKTPFIY